MVPLADGSVVGKCPILTLIFSGAEYVDPAAVRVAEACDDISPHRIISSP
jgi:hypothetical protein